MLRFTIELWDGHDWTLLNVHDIINISKEGIPADAIHDYKLREMHPRNNEVLTNFKHDRKNSALRCVYESLKSLAKKEGWDR